MLWLNKNNFLSKLIFTVTKFYQYRKLLQKCLIYNNFPQTLAQLPQEFAVDRITLLELNSLKQSNIEVLILDYDGVLCPQGEIKPLPEVISWLEQATLIFGAKKIFILSNNPLLERQEFLNKYFNNQIIFIVTKPKPYPDGIIEICDYLKLTTGQIPEKSRMLFVDDRLSTGILAAKIFGIVGCLILKPYTNIKKRFLIESSFIVIRKLERLILCHL